MAKCAVCGKGIVSGKQYSHSHRKSNRAWKPNLQRVRVILDGKPRKVDVCTRCLRSNKVQRYV
ncbi:MAG: 50S ribosomal protein L28 [Syntrophomonadaceae bacterium]|nr:50S ribosomal protein L28 [Syntrophomonadaceae bacterium]